MQSIIISGNVGQDAEVHEVGNTTVCNFSVACNEKGRNGAEDVTTWYRCAVWGRRGEALQPYIRKGTKVTASGRLSLKVFTGSDGVPRVDATVNVDDLDFFNGGGAPQAQERPARQPQPQGDDMFDEEIPF